MPKFEDISGQTFGKALAIKRVSDHIKPNGQPVVRYLCFCECGKTFIAAKSNLVRLHTTSCGCSREKKKGLGMKHCAYHPGSVDCFALNCQQCGWNPYNVKLRKKRIEEVIARREKNADESYPAAEDF